MGDNLRLVLLGVFFVVILGCIGFLVLNEGEEPISPVSERVSSTGAEKASGSTTLPGASGFRPNQAGKSSSPVEVDSGSDSDAPEIVAAANEEKSATADPDRPKARRPRGPGVVKGVVTWHGDGAPVSGANILLDYTNRPNRYDPYPDERAEWTTHTDSNGEFRIDNLPVNDIAGDRGGRLTIIAEKDGASAVGYAGLIDDETMSIVELSLRPSGGIEGQVLNADGDPVAGAVVTPHEMAEESQRQYSYGARGLWARTGTDGRFRLANMNKGAWKLSVNADGYAAKISDAIETGERDAKIVLEQGAALSGTVIAADGGQPIPNIFVTVRHTENYNDQQRSGTDKNGEFSVSALADGEYLIQLDDEERILMGEAPRVKITQAQPVDGITLEVANGGVISGMVTDADTGNPIEGIRIQARGNNRSTGRELQGMSDASGFYQITGLPGGSYTLRRRWKEGYLHGEYRENKSVSLGLGETLENIDFVVRRGLTIAGIVIDKSGEPVEGIRVEAKPTVENGEGEDVQTVEGGKFEVRGFSPNVEVYIDVSGRGYTAPRTGPLNTGDAGLDNVKIIVEAGASIAGVVVNQAGKLLPEMYVTATSSSGQSAGSVTSGPEGEFTIKSLDEGEYRLQARHRNSWSNSQRDGQTVTVTKGQELTGVRVVFDGSESSTITGTVTNKNREPLKDVSVNAHSPTGGSSAYTQTGDDGSYTLETKEGLAYNLHVYHQSHTTQQREGVAAGERNVDFVMEGRGTVEGRVLDASTGRPIVNFEIGHQRGLAQNNQYQYGNFTSFYNEEGRFSLNNVEAGESTIFARASGYAPDFTHVPNVEADSVTGGVEFRLSPGASIEGVVLDLNRSPIQNAQIFTAGRVDEWMIRQSQYGGNGSAAATTDANGAFVIDSVGDDLTAITATHPEYPNSTVQVELKLGQATQVEIIMSGGATIEGTVYVNGQPSADENVYAHSPQGGNGRSAKTDANGYYKIENMPAGELSVSANVVRDGTRRGKSETVTVEAGFTTTLDLYIEYGNAIIEGTVSSGGSPVSGVQVVAMMTSSGQSNVQHVGAEIGTDGSFRVSGLTAGDYRLMVHTVPQQGGTRQMRHVDVSVQDGQAAQVNIDLDAGLHLRGTVSGVLDSQRCQVLALTGVVDTSDLATLAASPRIQSLMASFSSIGADGTYDLAGLEPGTYTVIALEYGSNGWADARFGTGQVEISGQGDQRLDLALP